MLARMNGDGHRATIRRFFEDVVGRGDIDLIDALAVEDYLDHVALPGQAPNRDGLKWRIGVIRGALSPRHTLHDVLVDDDLVAVRWTLRGEHTGPFIGLAATNKPFELDGIELYRMRDGRMAEHWNVVDLFRFYTQVTK